MQKNGVGEILGCPVDLGMPDALRPFEARDVEPLYRILLQENI